MDHAALQADLLRDEGEELSAYRDSLGYLTIGVGHLIDSRKGGKIPKSISRQLLELDIAEKLGELQRRVPFWGNLSPGRQRAFTNMAFQLGTDGLMKFRKALALAERAAQTEGRESARLWQQCADEALDSAWHSQTPERAERVAQLIREG